ncbi:MAG: transposase [Janthinobacterium lividum]
MIGQLGRAILVNARSPKRTRRRYTAKFKMEVVLAALTECQPLAELAAHYQLDPAQISRWKLHLRQQAAQAFAEAPALVVSPRCGASDASWCKPPTRPAARWLPAARR